MTYSSKLKVSNWLVRDLGFRYNYKHITFTYGSYAPNVAT